MNKKYVFISKLFLISFAVKFQLSTSQSRTVAPFKGLENIVPLFQPSGPRVTFPHSEWNYPPGSSGYEIPNSATNIYLNTSLINFNTDYSYYYCYAISTDEVHMLFNVFCNDNGWCDIQDANGNYPDNSITGKIKTWMSNDLNHNHDYNQHSHQISIEYNAFQVQICASKDRYSYDSVLNKSSVKKQDFGTSMSIISMKINNRIIYGKPNWIDISGKPSSSGMLKDGDFITVSVFSVDWSDYSGYLPWGINDNNEDLYASPVSGGIESCSLSVQHSKTTGYGYVDIFNYKITLHNDLNKYGGEECKIEGNEEFRFKIYSDRFENAQSLSSTRKIYYRMKTSRDKIFPQLVTDFNPAAFAMMPNHDLKPNSQIHSCEFKDDQNNTIGLHLPNNKTALGTIFDETISDYIITVSARENERTANLRINCTFGNASSSNALLNDGSTCATNNDCRSFNCDLNICAPGMSYQKQQPRPTTCNVGESKVNISFYNGPSTHENSWEILNNNNVTVKSGTQDDGPTEICLADGDYTLKGKDSLNDGWNDGAQCSSCSSNITLTDKDGVDIVSGWVGPQNNDNFEDTTFFSLNVGAENFPMNSDEEYTIAFENGRTDLFLNHYVAGEYRIRVNVLTGWLPTEPDFHNADIESIHGIKDDIYTNNYTQVVQTMNAHLHIIGCICCGSNDADSGPSDDSGSSGPYDDSGSSGSYDDSGSSGSYDDSSGPFDNSGSSGPSDDYYSSGTSGSSGPSDDYYSASNSWSGSSGSEYFISGDSNSSSFDEQKYCGCKLCTGKNLTETKRSIVASNGGAQIFRILNGAHLTIKYLNLSGVNQSKHCQSSDVCKGESYSQLTGYEYTEMEYRENRSCYSCYGSAIYLDANSKLTMIHTIIQNNIGGRGAIYGAYNADISIQHSLIMSNIATKLKCEIVSKSGNEIVNLTKHDHTNFGSYFHIGVGIYKNVPSYSSMSGKGARFTIEVRGPLRHNVQYNMYGSYGYNHHNSIVSSHYSDYWLSSGCGNCNSEYALTWYYNVPTITTSTLGSGARFNISIHHGMYNGYNNSIGDIVASDPGSNYTTFDKLIIRKENVGLTEDLILLLNRDNFNSDDVKVENIIIENGGTGYSLNEYVRISGDYFYNCYHSPCFEFYLNNAKYLNADAKQETCLSYGSGGGIYASSGTRLSISNSNIQNNIAEASGGGIKYHQSHVQCVHYLRTVESSSCHSYTIEECKYNSGCRKESMQGLTGNHDATFIMNNTNVSENVANVSGGGIYTTFARKTNFLVYDSFITRNIAKSTGGGIVIDTSNYFHDHDDSDQPINYTRANFIGITIENNTANDISKPNSQGHQVYYMILAENGNKLRHFTMINMQNKYNNYFGDGTLELLYNGLHPEVRDHFSGPVGTCYTKNNKFYTFFCGVTQDWCSDTACPTHVSTDTYCSTNYDRNQHNSMDWNARKIFGINCFEHTSCDPGWYVGAEPSSQSDRTCHDCNYGRFSNQMNAKYCNDFTVCRSGEYISTFGSTTSDHTCSTCLAGKYNVYGDASGACQLCEIGKFTMCEGRESCDVCPEGMTTDVEGSTMCKSAMLNIIDRLPPEQLTVTVPLNEPRITLCLSFDPDTTVYANNEVTTTYFVQYIKKGGSFSKPEDINEVMVECEYGTHCTYCSTSDTSTPVYLDTSSYKVGVETSAGRGVPSDPYPFWSLATDCGPTQYLDEASENPREWQCQTCPKGGDCNGHTIWTDIKPKFGYFRLGPVDSDPDFFDVCLNPMACLGGINLQLEGRYFHEEAGHANPDMSLANDDEGCNKYLGYADECKGSKDNSSQLIVNGKVMKCRPRLCRACRFGYWAQGVSNCKLCPPPLLNYIVTALGVLFVCFMLYTFIKTALDEQGKNATSPHHHFAQPMQKIILNHLQLISLASGFPMKWPDAVEAMFEVQGVMGSAGDYMYNPACTEEAVEQGNSLFFQKQAGLLSLPFICMALSALFWTVVAIKNCCLRCIYKRKREKFNACDKFTTTTVILLYLLYPTLCKSTFSLVACKPVGKKLYLQMDLDLPCYEKEHMGWLYALFFPSLFIYILGLPMLSTCMLRCNKHHLKSSRVKFRFGILYSGYTSSAYYWETVIATRKAAVVAISVFLNNMGTELQALFALIVTVIYLIMHVDQRPYMAITDKHHTLHDAEAGALMVAFFTMWCGLLFFQDAVVGTFQLVITVLLISANAIYMLFAVRLYVILKVMDMDEEMSDGSKGSAVLIQVAKLFKCCIPHWLRGTRNKKASRAKTKIKALNSFKKITPARIKRDEDDEF